MPGIVSYLVRKASEHDATRIAEIQVQTWRAAYRGLIADDYLDELDAHRRAVFWKSLIGSPEEVVQVAVKDSRIVGFCSLLPSRDSAAPPEIAEISTLYVEPSEWGRGAGTCLAEAAIEYASTHGFVAVTLWVLAGNERAQGFYTKLGFTRDGAEKEDHLRGFPIHEIRYRREL